MKQEILVYIYHIQTDELLALLSVSLNTESFETIFDEDEAIDNAVWGWCLAHNELWEDIEWVKGPKIGELDV